MVSDFVCDKNEFDGILKKIGGQDIILIPVFSKPYLHPTVDTLSFVVVYHNNQRHILNFNNVDAPKLPQKILAKIKCNSILVPDKKQLYSVLVGPNIRCAKTLLFHSGAEYKNKLEDNTLYNKLLYSDDKNIDNDIVPISKYLESIENIHTIIKGIDISAPITYIEDVASDVYGEIETAGLKIDEDVFSTHFEGAVHTIVDGMVYCQYNLHNNTGRPSNKFSAVNYSALNKTSGARNSFISRHSEGMLVQFDFEAFHLRLLAKEIGYDLPTRNFHQFLAKNYFKTHGITEELYNKGKQITFSHLYSDEIYTGNITFLQKVSEFRYTLWDMYKEGKISPEIHIPTDATPSLVLNYITQNIEYRTMTGKLKQLLNLFRDKSSKIILTTYDSILIDYNILDGHSILLNAKRILEEDTGKFPVSVEFGKKYGLMKKIDLNTP